MQNHKTTLSVGSTPTALAESDRKGYRHARASELGHRLCHGLDRRLAVVSARLGRSVAADFRRQVDTGCIPFTRTAATVLLANGKATRLIITAAGAVGCVANTGVVVTGA